MTLIVYGDFNCPYCYLASQRADRLIRDRVVRYLTDLAHTASVPPRRPAGVEATLGRGREPGTSASAA